MTEYRVNTDLKLDVNVDDAGKGAKEIEDAIDEEVKKFLRAQHAEMKRYNDPLVFDFKVIGFNPTDDEESA